jgi:hypothetical protein
MCWRTRRNQISSFDGRASPFKSAGASVQSTTGSRDVRISGSNAGYTMFRSSVKGTAYPLHSPVSPSLPLPCVTVCHHVSTGLYHQVQHKIILIVGYLAFMCFVRISEQSVTLACVARKVWICVTEVESVYCAVRTESLYKKTFSVFKELIC